jgi:predicted nucleic acid-binding protein
VGVTRYLADKSALARLHIPGVREELEPLIVRALVGICGVTELEMLFSARNIQERARMKEQLAASLEHVDTPEDIWDLAAEIQEALTEQAQHRCASIPDLLVAATARARGLEILHYDRDFDTIARCTEQPTRWIVPPGTVLSPLVPVVSLRESRLLADLQRHTGRGLRHAGLADHGCRSTAGGGGTDSQQEQRGAEDEQSRDHQGRAGAGGVGEQAAERAAAGDGGLLAD